MSINNAARWTRKYFCCNGCDAPPYPPSKILCRKCFAALHNKLGKTARALGMEWEDMEAGDDA